MIVSLGYANAVNVAPLKRSSWICGGGGGGNRWKRRRMPSFAVVEATSRSPATSSSSNAAVQLRTQLDQLQAEAEATRSKANSARLRLLRLSEVAEKLRRQAARYIQNGKENEARELLLQKNKVMQALERSKSRIELLDKLSGKLNEAISLKETQLIENLTVLSEVSTIDADQTVHIISPHNDVEDPKTSGFVDSSILKVGGTGEMECHSLQADKPEDNLQPVAEKDPRISFIHGGDKFNILGETSSFNNFLEGIDGHLREIESDLVTVLKLPASVPKSEHMWKSSNVQDALQILDDICTVRKRIATIIQGKTEES